MVRRNLTLALSLAVCAALVGCNGGPQPKIRCPGDGVATPTAPSPEGRIVWASEGGAGPCIAIYTMYPDGTGIRRLTPPALYLPSAPSWSPDARLIAFMGQCDTEERADLCVMDSNGGGRRTVTKGPVVTYNAATWSPDGTRLAFGRTTTAPGSATSPSVSIQVVAIDGSAETTIVSDGEEPAWSPDGRRIAFVSGREGTNKIYVTNVDGTGTLRLSDGPHDSSPAWSPDGRRIVYASGRAGKPEFLPDNVRRNPQFVPPTNLRPARPANDIYVMDANGSAVVRLTNDPSDNVTPTWSPDGRRIAFSSVRDGNYELYAMNADGTGVKRLTNLEGSDVSPSWR